MLYYNIVLGQNARLSQKVQLPSSKKSYTYLTGGSRLT